jgi:hypothetical protein
MSSFRPSTQATNTAGILQYNPIQSAILQNLIGQIFATELDYIGECPQCNKNCGRERPNESHSQATTVHKLLFLPLSLNGAVLIVRSLRRVAPAACQCHHRPSHHVVRVLVRRSDRQCSGIRNMAHADRRSQRQQQRRRTGRTLWSPGELDNIAVERILGDRGTGLTRHQVSCDAVLLQVVVHSSKERYAIVRSQVLHRTISLAF